MAFQANVSHLLLEVDGDFFPPKFVMPWNIESKRQLNERSDSNVTSSEIFIQAIANSFSNCAESTNCKWFIARRHSRSKRAMRYQFKYIILLRFNVKSKSGGVKFPLK